ncbi:DUF1493 family protein [Marinilabiliaceae bacterium JC017]|nr:DUF1493 family protein [Marinilabiliaceae bacterium JC017]
MMKTNIFNQILDLIPDHMFPKGMDKNRNLRLEEDLTIYGDDAVEFIEKFSVKFKVDIRDLDYGKYFTKETSFYFLVKYFISKNKRFLTLGDLENAVKVGKLE